MKVVLSGFNVSVMSRQKLYVCMVVRMSWLNSCWCVNVIVMPSALNIHGFHV